MAAIKLKVKGSGTTYVWDLPNQHADLFQQVMGQKLGRILDQDGINMRDRTFEECVEGYAQMLVSDLSAMMLVKKRSDASNTAASAVAPITFDGSTE